MKDKKIKEIQKQVGEILKDIDDEEENISVIIEHKKVLDLEHVANWIIKKIKKRNK